MRHPFVSALIVLASTVPAGRASAQEPPAAPAPSSTADTQSHENAAAGVARDVEDLARLTELLQRFSSEAHDHKNWAALSTIVIAAATIPAGIVMLNQPDGKLPGAATTGAGIGLALGAGLILVVPTLGSFQPVADVLEKGRAEGKPPGAIVRDVEAKWRSAADSMSDIRKTLGGLDVCFGAVFLAGGTYLAFADVSTQDFSKREQYGWAGALSVFGTFSVVFGLRGLFLEEPIESAWHAYESQRPHAAPPVKVTGVGLTPVPGGGAVVGLSAAF